MPQGMDAWSVKMCHYKRSCLVRVRVGVTELQAIFRDQEKNLREETENKEPWWQAKSQEEVMLWKAKEYV